MIYFRDQPRYVMYQSSNVKVALSPSACLLLPKVLPHSLAFPLHFLSLSLFFSRVMYAKKLRVLPCAQVMSSAMVAVWIIA